MKICDRCGMKDKETNFTSDEIVTYFIDIHRGGTNLTGSYNNSVEYCYDCYTFVRDNLIPFLKKLEAPVKKETEQPKSECCGGHEHG